MCVRGEVGAVAQRGSIFPIANFALRFSSPSPCPTRTLSSPIHPISRRAPRFPRRTIHSSAPALSTTTPPSYATFSLDPPVSSALYNTASGRPNRWCRCRHNKNVEKAMANVHADGRERGEKEPRRSCIRLPLRWRDRGIAPVFRAVIHEAPDEIPRPRFLFSPPPFS